MINVDDKMKETRVPDHVFFGLTEGMINGPLIILPNIKATVSLKKAIKMI